MKKKSVKVKAKAKEKGDTIAAEFFRRLGEISHANGIRFVTIEGIQLMTEAGDEYACDDFWSPPGNDDSTPVHKTEYYKKTLRYI